MNIRTLWSTTPALLAALFAGCGTIPELRPPTQVGQVRACDQVEGLQVEIKPLNNLAVIGVPIAFEIAVRNTGDHAFWLPKEPPLRFHIVYASGRRDNYLEDPSSPHFYQEHESVRLNPGDSITTQFEVKTYYFDRAGITEFYAVVDPAKNTNPALSPFWDGRAKSNVYGIYVQPRRALDRYTEETPIPAG